MLKYTLLTNMQVRYVRPGHKWHGWEGRLANIENGLVRFDGRDSFYVSLEYLVPLTEFKTMFQINSNTRPQDIMFEGHPEIVIDGIRPAPNSSGQFGNWQVMARRKPEHTLIQMWTWGLYDWPEMQALDNTSLPSNWYCTGVNDDGSINESNRHNSRASMTTKPMPRIVARNTLDLTKPFFGVDQSGGEEEYKLVGTFTPVDGSEAVFHVVPVKAGGGRELKIYASTGKVVSGMVGSALMFKNGPIEKGYDDRLAMSNTKVRVTELNGVVTKVELA